MSSRGHYLAADFRRAQPFAENGFCPLTPFGRVGLFSHDGVSPRTFLVTTWPLTASVYLTLAAFRHWRHSSLRVVRACAALRRLRLLSPGGDQARAYIVLERFFVRARRFALRVFYPQAAFFRLRLSSARVLWPLVRSSVSAADTPMHSVPPPCGGDERDPHGKCLRAARKFAHHPARASAKTLRRARGLI